MTVRTFVKREVRDRAVQILHLIGRARDVHHLDEGDGIDRHLRVVLGDHFLAGDIEHHLHHRDLAPDTLEQWIDQPEARLQRAHVLAESLDRPAITLRHEFDRPEDDDDGGNKERDDERRAEILEHVNKPLLLKVTRPRLCAPNQGES